MIPKLKEDEWGFAVLLAAGAVLAAVIPALAGLRNTPPGAAYLGYQFNTDDHMVYAAWMRQAMDGHLLMDNRFTTDPQPGLTINIYFFVLGLLAKVLGIALAANLARLVFGFGFVILLLQLIRRLDVTNYARKLALALAVFGGGIGFLVWQSFGREIVTKGSDPVSQAIAGGLSHLLNGRLPTDVWQPEGFVFPSMLTNGLFMVSLCLIVTIFTAVLSAREGWTRVAYGAGAALILMNIHSYDMLLIGLVLLGLVAMEAARRTLTFGWILRSAVIVAGAVPSAIWFLYVLANDPVFRSRAATETYSPDFMQVLCGYLPMIVLGFVALVARPAAGQAERRRRYGGAYIAAAVFVSLALASRSYTQGYLLGAPAWALCFVLMLVALALLADENPTWNLIASWALIGSIALYFPGLFQRKLAMGLAVPWAILAAIAIAYLCRNSERYARNLATTLVIVLFSASSMLWFIREKNFIVWNVSSTTVQPVYLNPDVVHILNALNAIGGRKVVVAPPGRPNPTEDPDTHAPQPDSFGTPVVPDLNPIVSGMTGSYTYAGHWSETPDYIQKRNELAELYFGEETPQQRADELRRIGANYMIAPVPEAFPGAGLFDFSRLGKVLVDGNQFRLIQLS